MIIQDVRLFLSAQGGNDSRLPWDVVGSADLRVKERGAKIQAIEERLGVLPNGSMVPLTSRQQALFGTSVGMLEYKIQKARLGARGIVKTIESFPSWEADIRDTRLMRHFILECLSPFKRYTLEKNNLAHDEDVAERSFWIVYIASWIFFTGAVCFFIYWIFAWGLYEGGDTLAAWGAVYGAGAANDIILVSVTKVILVNYLPAQAMQAQLLRIRRVLADISLNYINRNEQPPRNGDVTERGNVSGNDSTICVVQHMSAACRAARSKELKDLPAAWLLRQVT